MSKATTLHMESRRVAGFLCYRCTDDNKRKRAVYAHLYATLVQGRTDDDSFMNRGDIYANEQDELDTLANIHGRAITWFDRKEDMHDTADG
jgi:hypothetical protein